MNNNTKTGRDDILFKTSHDIDLQRIPEVTAEIPGHCDQPASHPAGHSVPRESNRTVSLVRLACVYAADTIIDEIWQ